MMAEIERLAEAACHKLGPTDAKSFTPNPPNCINDFSLRNLAADLYF